MPANKKNMAPISASSPKPKAPRKKPWVDPDDIPDQSGVPIEKWTARINGIPVKIGRPPVENPKRPITIRLDPDLVDFYKATGNGWQSRINADLRKVTKLGVRAKS